MRPPRAKYFNELRRLLQALKIELRFSDGCSVFSKGNKTVKLDIPYDIAFRKPAQLAALVSSKLDLNQRVFARKCEVRRLDRAMAEDFLNRYHLMGATGSAYNYGLVYREDLLAVAAFSKGRKMNRLPAGKKSFELIRFCTKSGLTVTGGLSRLVRSFCREKNAGDIMTYIDKQYSTAESFRKAGFVQHSETLPNCFLLNKKTLERTPVTDENLKFDKDQFDLIKNAGNIKLVYKPEPE